MAYFQEEEKANMKLGPCVCKEPCKNEGDKPGLHKKWSKKKVSINISSFSRDLKNHSEKSIKQISLTMEEFFLQRYSASHSRVAPENVGLQNEQKCNTFAFIPVMKCGCVF
jgi:hypothetical protein